MTILFFALVQGLLLVAIVVRYPFGTAIHTHVPSIGLGGGLGTGLFTSRLRIGVPWDRYGRLDAFHGFTYGFTVGAISGLMYVTAASIDEILLWHDAFGTWHVLTLPVTITLMSLVPVGALLFTTGLSGAVGVIVGNVVAGARRHSVERS